MWAWSGVLPWGVRTPSTRTALPAPNARHAHARAATACARAVSVYTLLLACALAVWGADQARASDFWDSVRGAPRGGTRELERVERARSAIAANRADEAIAVIGAVQPKEPGEAELLIVRGRAQAMVNLTREALASYERAAAVLDPRAIIAEPDALAMARLALQAGRYALALRALSGLADGAERPQTRAALRAIEGHILQAMGPDSLEQAIAAYREALRAVPEHASALLGLALALHRQGSREAALAVAKRVRDPAQLEQSLLETALPSGERHARSALWRESIADMAAARAEWHEAMQQPGPWREHARSTLLQLDARGAPSRSTDAAPAP